MKQTLICSLVTGLVLFVLSWATPAIAADEGSAQLFETHCAGCHLNGGNILRRGKTLKLKALQKNEYDTPEAIADIITNGKNNMSAFADRLDAAEISQLSDYVLEQAQQGWS